MIGGGDASSVVYEPEREAGHLQPSSAEIKNAWIHPYTYPYSFMKYIETNLSSLESFTSITLLEFNPLALELDI